MNKSVEYTIEEIEGLIKEVGYPCNTEMLMKDLNSFINDYIVITATPQKNKKARLSELNKVKSSCKEFYDKISEHLVLSYDFLDTESGWEIPNDFTEKEIEITRGTLARLIKFYSDKESEVDEIVETSISDAMESNYTSFKNVMLCSILPRVYESHFERKIGFSRSSSDGTASGPAVRFIEAVSRKVGSGMQPNSIIKAYQRLHT